jgi:hypothetical protein
VDEGAEPLGRRLLRAVAVQVLKEVPGRPKQLLRTRLAERGMFGVGFVVDDVAHRELFFVPEDVDLDHQDERQEDVDAGEEFAFVHVSSW